MILNDMERLYPSAKILVRDRAASRIHAKDASLYSFSESAEECARNFMGWTDLASNPPYPVEKIQEFADLCRVRGMKNVVLLGQGGSTQAPMTITKYNSVDDHSVSFRVLDSDSPVRVRSILSDIDPHRTIFLVSSKSGGTIEPRLALLAVRAWLRDECGMAEKDIVKRLVAVTDPGSNLEKQAKEEGWEAVFPGEPTVGGRFSALSVFGLLPAAFVGLNLESFVQHAAIAEKQCGEDAIDNPAISLASFMYDNYLLGRNKFSFLTPKRGRVLGLWIEQLVAESVGKDGRGVLPNIEVDTLVLADDPGDRTVIMYQTQNDSWDERKNFEMSLAYVDQSIPRMNFKIDTVEELAEHFVMWEYATAMLGYLMKVCPFDQPDVASAKAAVLDILANGHPEPDLEETFLGNVDMGLAEVRLAPCFKDQTTIQGAIDALIASIKPGDYFAMNAFLPFTGEGRREALEAIRHSVAAGCGVVSCLEVGPRYLHSTGQLHKGGMDGGVFLIVSADELKDIPLPQEAESLGMLAKSQAEGDFKILSERGRRVVHLHLPDNSGVTIRMLTNSIRAAIGRAKQ